MYTSVSDVKALAPHVPITNTSQPSEGTVNQWIGELEAMYDAQFRTLGFETPITGVHSVVIVRQIIAHAVMARVMRSRPNPESDPENFQRWADTRMKALRDPNDPFDLDDAGKVDAAIKLESGMRVSSNFRDIAAEPDTRITVTRDLKF
ncbi:MAG TPA: hypothetical protein VIK76_02285 [Pyrinomonadaceae bacterium]|jgi:hypothetical protein